MKINYHPQSGWIIETFFHNIAFFRYFGCALLSGRDENQLPPARVLMKAIHRAEGG